MKKEGKPLRVFADNVRPHSKYTGDNSWLEQIRGNPDYVMRFLPGVVLERAGIADLDEARRLTREHMQLLKDCGVKTAWVNTYRMQNDLGDDGLWTVSEGITRVSPQTPEEVRDYVDRVVERMNGLLEYYKKCGTYHLWDIARVDQWIYGKNLNGELGLYLVDVDPHFNMGTNRLTDTLLKLAQFVADEYAQIRHAWPSADISRLPAIVDEIEAVQNQIKSQG